MCWAAIHNTKGGISTARRAYERYPSVQKFCADAGYRGAFVFDLKEQLDLDVDISEKIKPHQWEILPWRDDLGVERNTEYALEQMFSIINSRYRCNKPLIVTTNLKLDELKHLPDLAHVRIYDRVLERCAPSSLLERTSGRITPSP